MIQDYLKTSLVFYDDIDKQHRSNDCCLENENWNKLISPDDRFLPFQIRIPTDEWVGDINTIQLYDENDVLVANLITGYGMRNVIYVLANCLWNDTYVWVIYNGQILSDTLPDGNHYIRITDDAGNAWYSEIFSICTMTEQTELGVDLVDEWNNAGNPLDFTTFNTNGSEIIQAADAAAGAIGYSNTIFGCRGDRIYYDIDFVQSGINISMTATAGLLGAAVSNTVVLGATNRYTGHLTLTQDGEYVITLLAAALGSDFAGEFSFKLRTTTTFNSMLGIEWYNDCDFDGIIYQEINKGLTQLCGYSNRLYFPVKLESPRTETVKDGAETLGVFNTNSIVQKKFYMFKVLVPEFLYNVLQTLQLYANNTRSVVNIYLDNGDIAEVMELNILEEWVEGNCYATLTVEFREDAVVWTNCCDNYALVDESSCS